ncbi:hypothetical protein IFM89_032909 [Coptis chinensis]|uniref:Transposase n=1 Tax=Coptis chinensis TaxID=261450 RepID=A0A835ISE4_9MAGN|nr:hypothetical protein IFM89_032909 [Coptis chinensis]
MGASMFKSCDSMEKVTITSQGNKKIEFDADGQAVGDDSYSYSSALGGTAKTHCPIFYESFKDVPSPTKRLIWKKIKDEYGIAEVYKKCQLKKFAKSWREYKHRLQVKHYDKYDNDDERKRHCPKGVKREDWDRFVDNEAKPSRKRMRLVGKNSRKALKSLHTSGRRGAARTIHNLKKKNPNVKITRTLSYMAIHTRKDGSFLVPERMARINAIIEDDPSSIDLDLDNDPVAQVCGPDQYGRVLGIGVGVSKTSLIASGPAKEKLHQETQQRTMVEERVGTIEKHMITLTQILMEIKDQCTKSVVADTSTSSVLYLTYIGWISYGNQQIHNPVETIHMDFNVVSVHENILLSDQVEEILFQSFEDDCRLLGSLLNDVLQRKVGDQFIQTVERKRILAQVKKMAMRAISKLWRICAFSELWRI